MPLIATTGSHGLPKQAEGPRYNQCSLGLFLEDQVLECLEIERRQSVVSDSKPSQRAEDTSSIGVQYLEEPFHARVLSQSQEASLSETKAWSPRSTLKSRFTKPRLLHVRVQQTGWYCNSSHSLHNASMSRPAYPPACELEVCFHSCLLLVPSRSCLVRCLPAALNHGWAEICTQ